MSEQPSAKLTPQMWRTIGVVLLGPMMSQIDSTVVNVSLANIRDSLHATISSAQWVISGYLLALALMLPLNGWLVDRIGAKRLYLLCFSGFTLASLFCGASQTMDQLILARILQGMAGGLLAPMTQLMLARIAGKQMARVISIAGIPILVAPILGPVLAGAILKYAGWSWLFYINLPIGVLAVALAWWLLPHDESEIVLRPFDLSGFAMISPSLAMLLYGFEQATTWTGRGFLAIGVLLLVLFIFHARRLRERALIDLSLFGNSTFNACAQTQFLSNGILYAGQFLVPLYLVSGVGLSPTDAGWILTAMGIGMLFSYPTMGWMVDKFGNRHVAVAGVLINSLGTLPFLYVISTGYSPWLTALALVLRGAGQGATGVPTLSAAYASLPREKLSNGTTAINIVQRLGGPILTTAMSMAVAFGSHATVGAQVFLAPFIVLIALQALIAVSAMRLPARV